MALRYPGLPSLSQATYTTANLAAGASETGLLFLGKTGRIKLVTTTSPARVQLYRTSANRTSDLLRAYTVRPSAGQGVILDMLTSLATLQFQEDVLYSNGDSPNLPQQYLNVTNTGLAGSVSVTFFYLLGEL